MVNDYVLDKDGNIYVLVPRSVSQLNGLNDNDGLVIKINSAGIPDRTFNGMGYAVIHNMTLFPNWDQPYRWSTYLRVSGDGSKITVYSGQFGDVIHSYRLTSDGLPDYSYGDKGCRNISLPTSGGILQDIKQTADGGVLLYNCRGASDSLLYSVTKLDADGDIDLSFNKTGSVSIQLPGDINTPFYVGSLFLPSGGFLMETRTAFYLSDPLYDLNCVKINADGSIDSSYGSNGVVTIPFSKYAYATQFASVHSILLSDNSLLTMLMHNNGSEQLFQFKLTPGGIIDSSYGINGMNTTGFGNTTNFIGRHNDPNDLHFWAYRETTDSAGYVSMRIKPDGYIDSSFIHTSRVSNPFYNGSWGYGQFDKYALVSGQHLIGAWTYGTPGLVNDGTLSLARLDQDAVIDPSFGVNGKVLLTSGVSIDQLVNIAPLPDGRMIGIAADGVKLRLFRVNNDGHIDPGFGNGRKLVDLYNGNYPQFGSSDLLIDRDNRIVVAAINYETSVVNQMNLFRYTVDGQLDPSFGQGGNVVLNNQVTSSEALLYSKSILQPDNKILLLYRRSAPSKSVVSILRLNENGTVDNTFGNNGWCDFNYLFDFPETFTVLHDGSILVSGTYQDGSKQYLTKISSSGQQLAPLGTYPYAFTVQGTSDDHVFFLGETDSGKIVYALMGRDYTNQSYTLAGRLNSDLSYDQNAKMTYVNGDKFFSAQLLHDGRLVLAGMHNTANSPSHLAMVVTKPDLSVDSLVGDNGILTYPDVLPDTLTQTNPYADFGAVPSSGYIYNQVFCFKDANGQIVTAATAKKDSLSDVFLIRHLFDDTAKGYTYPVLPQPKGSLVVWTRALCPNQGFINLYLYDSTGVMVLMPNTTAILVSALKMAPACSGNGGYTYTVPAGNYTLKAFCGTDSLVSRVTVIASGCTAKDVTFDVPPIGPPVTPPVTPPNDTTSNRPPIDSTATPHQVTVFPNPTNGTVDIRLPGPDNGNILIADMTGKVIRQIAFNGQEVKINLTRLEKGYYMVQVKGKLYTRTLTVLKL